MKKETIVYIGGFDLPLKNAAAHRVMANAEMMLNIGYEVELIGISKSSNNFENECYKQGINLWSISYPHSKKEWFEYISNNNLAINILDKIRSNKLINKIVCYNYQSIPFIKLMRYCKKNNIELISDVTEWYGDIGGNLFRRIIKKIDTSTRMRILNKSVNSLIVSSEYLANYYKNKNTIVLPTLLPDDVSLHSEISFKNFETIIAYAGIPFRIGEKLSNRKLAKDRLDIILKSLNEIKDEVNFKFNIYGITREEYLFSLPEDESLLISLKNNVNFEGRKSTEILKEEIKKADFTILIRDVNRMTQAGFPTKVTESINLNIPVITNDTSDIKKYISNDYNGYILDVDNEVIKKEDFKSILQKDKEEVFRLKNNCYKNNPFKLSNWETKLQRFLERQ